MFSIPALINSAIFMTTISLCAMVAPPWLGKGKNSSSGALETRTVNVLHFSLLGQN